MENYTAYQGIYSSTAATVQIKKSNEDINIPKYQHNGDAGFDFESSEDVIIAPNETKLIGTGLFMKIPFGFELQIRPRSGLSLKTKLRVANSPGTIDSTYTGEIKIIMDNIGKQNEFIKKGDRIAQGVLSTVKQAIFVEVEELEKTDRGVGGFGSTGV